MRGSAYVQVITRVVMWQVSLSLIGVKLRLQLIQRGLRPTLLCDVGKSTELLHSVRDFLPSARMLTYCDVSGVFIAWAFSQCLHFHTGAADTEAFRLQHSLPFLMIDCIICDERFFTFEYQHWCTSHMLLWEKNSCCFVVFPYVCAIYK